MAGLAKGRRLSCAVYRGIRRFMLIRNTKYYTARMKSVHPTWAIQEIAINPAVCRSSRGILTIRLLSLVVKNAKTWNFINSMHSNEEK